MAHGDAREGKWRGNWLMEWVASTLHSTSEHGVSSIITADAHTSAASSRLYWRPRRFKWTRPFRRKTKSGLCACAIAFQTQSTNCCIEPAVWSRASATVFSDWGAEVWSVRLKQKLTYFLFVKTKSALVQPVSCDHSFRLFGSSDRVETRTVQVVHLRSSESRTRQLEAETSNEDKWYLV